MTIQRMLHQEFQPKQAKDLVRRLSMHHRIQASPGYTNACRMVTEFLDEAGIDNRTLTYPARAGYRFLNFASFQRWTPQDAWLELISPTAHELGLEGLLSGGRLASFREVPLSLVQRSCCTPGGPVETELVDVGQGTHPSDYQGKETEGNLVLVRSSPQAVHKLAVLEHGAVGIVTDRTNRRSMQTDHRLRHARYYSSYWWYGHERKAFGFVITPSQGEYLRKRLERGPLLTRAYVDASFDDGTFELVEATISGRTDDEVIITSHLDHPMPGSVDNCSGVSVSLELARSFKSLLDRSAIQMPKRTLRFLYMGELLGSVAYVEERIRTGTLSRMVGGINLDMIGNDQATTGGSLLSVMPSMANYSYVGPLMRWLLVFLVKNDKLFSGYQGVADFRWDITSFSGGSDYLIFDAPDVDVPMVGLTSWPYLFYHTDKDLPENISDDSLRRYGILAGVFVYLLGCMEESSASWMIDTVVSEYSHRIEETSHDILTALMTAQGVMIGANHHSIIRSRDWALARIRLMREAYSDALFSIRKTIPEISENHLLTELQHMAQMAKTEERALHRIFDEFGITEQPVVPESEFDRFVPVKKSARGPIDFSRFNSILSYKEERELDSLLDKLNVTDVPVFRLLDYWIDGRRTTREIADNIYAETGHPLHEAIYKMIGFLRNFNIVDFVDRKD